MLKREKATGKQNPGKANKRGIHQVDPCFYEPKLISQDVRKSLESFLKKPLDQITDDDRKNLKTTPDYELDHIVNC